MKFTLQLQYADFDPDQVEKIGQVDLEQALNIIHSYPWDREFEKIAERMRENLSSTNPNVSITNDSHGLLTVSATNDDNFFVEFQNSTHYGNVIVPRNYFDNHQRFTIEEIVSEFYEGALQDVIELDLLDPIERDDVRVYKLTNSSLYIRALSAGILLLLLAFNLLINGLTPNALLLVSFAVLFILMTGLSTFVSIQYLLTDRNKEVSFELDGVITVKQKGKDAKINKGDIDQVAIVHNNNHRSLNKYKYARIKTKDGKAFIVTSFIMDPYDLVDKLRINYKDEPVFLPTINLDILTEKQKNRIKEKREKNKIKFMETFKDYEDAKLQEIIGDKTNYADYAIEAATELLARRK